MPHVRCPKGHLNQVSTCVCVRDIIIKKNMNFDFGMIKTRIYQVHYCAASFSISFHIYLYCCIFKLKQLLMYLVNTNPSHYYSC